MIQQGINLNDIGKLAKSNPKYATLLGELYGIDKVIKEFISDTIINYADVNVYFIKTELLNQCYNIYLFNSERNATLAYGWTFDDFLNKCQSKMIEKEIETVTKKIINTFNTDTKLSDTKINWIN